MLILIDTKKLYKKLILIYIFVCDFINKKDNILKYLQKSFGTIILFTLLFLNIYYNSYSQLLKDNKQFYNSITNELLGIKPSVSYGLNSHIASFNQFQGLIDCNEFTIGTGIGINFGIELETELSNKFMLSLGFGYSGRNGLLSRENQTTVRNTTTGVEELITTKAEIDTKINFIDFKPGVKINLVEFLEGPLFFTPAFRVSMPISGTFDQYEKISSPQTAVFTNPDGSRTTQRNLSKNNFETFNMPNLGVSFGLEKYFKVSHTNYISLGFNYDYNINNLLSDADWKINTMSFSLGYRYSIDKATKEIPVIEDKEPIKEEPVIVEIKKEEPIIIPPPPPSPYFDLEVVNEGTLAEVISGREILATIPVVNSVFFDDGSSEISNNYRKSFVNVNYFSGNAIEKHYYILPRIAKILKETSNAQLTIRGFTSGKYSPNENKKLATDRANNVKDIIVSMGISPNTIKIETPAEPDIKSTLEGLDLAVENRRVDLILQNAPLQNYVEIVSYKEVTGNLKITSKIYNSKDKVSLKSNISKNNYNLGNNDKLGIFYRHRVDVFSNVLDVKIDANLNELYKTYSNNFVLDTLKESFVNLNLENFEAVLRFDYNSSELSIENKELINQLYKLVPEGTTLVILGSTDTYGTEKRNKTLAGERANNTNAYIKTLKGRNVNLETLTTNEKFDESTPQGRFLNRSIRLRLKP